MRWNLMNDKKLGSIKLLKLKHRMQDQITQAFCKIGSPTKLGHPCLICRNLQNSKKSTPKSCIMYWNLMNDEKFGSLKLWKFK